VTLDPSDNATVAWSRDGRHLAFASARDGFINPYWQPIDRSRGVERLLTSERAHMPLLFLPDGRLAMAVQVEGRGGDIAALTLDGSGRLETLVGGPANQGNVDLDRSGRWLAYHSNESGQFEVYVTPFGDRRRAWLVSTDGGRDPWWSHDGRELFYRDFTGAIMSAEIAAGDTFHAAPPRKLIDGKGYLGSVGGHTYDVASDGRFLMIKEGDATPPSLILVLNWTQELKRLVPSRQGE
jgi:Tol biopolymer transport system component